MSDCDATTFLGRFRVRMVEICSRHSPVNLDSDFLPAVTWFERTFRSRLSFLPKTWVLANWSLPLNFSPSTLGRVFAESMFAMSCTNSSTLSVVLEIIHSESPDCLKSSCTPSTLQIEEKGSSLWVDTFQPKMEKIEFTQNSTCLASLTLARQRKSSKYADHINFKRDDPILQMAKETLRKAVTDAMDPKGRTLCLKIFAPLEEGSNTGL